MLETPCWAGLDHGKDLSCVEDESDIIERRSHESAGGYRPSLILGLECVFKCKGCEEGRYRWYKHTQLGSGVRSVLMVDYCIQQARQKGESWDTL